MMLSVKVCTKCKVEQPLSTFHRDKGKIDGRQTRCRKCSNKVRIERATLGGPEETVEVNMADYIKRKTAQGRTLTKGNIAIIEAVDNNGDDTVPKYKGLVVTGEMYLKAKEWLTKNGWGNPVQRSEVVMEPEKSREELVEALGVLFDEGGVK